MTLCTYKYNFLIQQSMLLLSIVLLLWSCNKESAPDCFKSAGEATTEKRELFPFTSIELNDYIQIELYDTTSYFVEITAPKNLIPEIETEVREGQLRVRNHNTCNFVRSFKKKLTVRIYAPAFPNIQNKGTGDITGINEIRSSYFKIENHHAAGAIRLQLNCDSTLIATHTGVCDIYLSGVSPKTSLFNQGYGVIDSRNLISSHVFINNSSISDVYAYSTEYLYASLRFSGNIYYLGHPNQVDSEIKGSGHLIKLN